MSPFLAFNTAISFVTNTNWQAYAGETTMSTLSQMAGLTVQNFLSAATGATLAAAVARAFAPTGGRGRRQLLGRPDTHHALRAAAGRRSSPAIVLVAMGLPQTLDAGVTAHTLEGATEQIIALGRRLRRKPSSMLGINGGGFFNANSLHPFENPSR
jgi:K+-transporting ATPase ATPase A chain